MALADDGATTQGSTGDDEVRVEAWETGVAMSIQGGWVVQMVLAENPDHPESSVVLDAKPPEVTVPGVGWVLAYR